MTPDAQVARQWARVEELDAQARALWDRVDKERKKLVRLAKLGRKRSVTVPISETKGLQITDKFRGETKVFAPAFARKHEFKEVQLD